ncbi:MAG TPA: YciI family protein [Candidatus Chromulinivoraceae bacterium]|nr:YciI family protein [Candidatus Chromulinivoraceae bacterium]
MFMYKKQVQLYLKNTRLQHAMLSGFAEIDIVDFFTFADSLSVGILRLVLIMKGIENMTKYILVYKMNEANDWSAAPEAEVKKVMQAWGEWLGLLGSAHKSGDAFKFGGKSATKDGVKAADNLLTGYAIIEAENFDEALAVAQKAPNVQAGTGTVEVYEAFGL